MSEVFNGMSFLACGFETTVLKQCDVIFRAANPSKTSQTDGQIFDRGSKLSTLACFNLN